MWEGGDEGARGSGEQGRGREEGGKRGREEREGREGGKRGREEREGREGGRRGGVYPGGSKSSACKHSLVVLQAKQAPLHKSEETRPSQRHHSPYI